MATKAEKGAEREAFLDALTTYREAARGRKYWEDNGHRGDGKLEAHIESERAARRALVAAYDRAAK